MSWLSDFLSALNPSSREEHFWAKIAGEEELENDTIPSSREEGFMYKIAQKIQGGSLPDASEASEGDVLTIDDGEPVWAAGGGGSGGSGEPFVITGTFSASSQIAGTVDKTDEEIYAAWSENKKLVFHLTVGTATLSSDLLALVYGEQQGSFFCEAIFAYQKEGKLAQIIVQEGEFHIQ